MGTQQFDINGNPITVPDAVGTPDQQVADTSGTLINPATEDGNILSVKTNTDKLDVNLSTIASESTASDISTKLTDASQKTQIVDESSNIVGTLVSISGINYLPVILSSAAVDGDPVPDRTVVISGKDSSGNAQTLKTNGSGALQVGQAGIWNINNISGTISLPTNAATETTLDGIKTDTDKLTFTSTRLLVDGSGVTQPISGNVIADAGTGTFTVGQATGTNLHTVIDSLPSIPAGSNVIGHVISDSGSTTVVTGNVTVVQPTGTNLHMVVDSGTITIDNATLAVTQSGTWNLNNISGVISLPTGASTAALQTQPGVDIGDVTINNASGASAVNIQDGGNSLTVDGTITANAGTGTFTVGQATGTNLHTVVDSGTITTITNVVHIDDNAGSLTVDGTITANQGGTWNITNISGTVSLPTGASTEASLAKLTLTQGSTTSGQSGTLVQGAVTTAAPAYTTAQTSPLSLDTSGRLRTDISSWIGSTAPTVGSKTSANSIPVVVASDQGAITVQDNASLIDNNAFTDGTTRVVAQGYILDETAGTALTENDIAAARIDSKRAQVFVIEDATTRGQRATVTASNAVKVDGSAVTQPVSGTVTANIGTSGSLALDATLAKLTITQGTTLGANTQVLTGGSVTTAAPTYTTGQISPLSLDTTGSLRVNVTSGGTSGVVAQSSTTSGQSGMLTQGAVTTAAPTYTTGQTNPISLTTTGSLRTDSTSWLGSTAPTVGQKTMANSVPVVIASDQSGATITTTPSDGTKATYSASITNLVMASTPTDVFTITGSATKTIRITRIYLTGTQTTGTTSDVLLIKRSTANSGGTSTTQTAIPYDSNNAAATATVRAYTANPTLGTAVGEVASYAMFIPSPTPANANSPFIAPDLFASIRPAQAIVLRGTTQVLSINFNSVTVTGNAMNIFIEWTEE